MTGSTEFIPVCLYKLGLIRVIEPSISNQKIIENRHCSSGEFYYGV